jgi:hypothetical protein
VTSRQSCRAFALPVALLLVVISAIMLTVMLERQGSHAFTVQKELEIYTFHHLTRGIGEGVEAWIRSNGSNELSGALEPDGHAFDLEVEGGQVVRIYFQEAQGTVLTDFAGLSGQSLELAAGAVDQLRRNEGEQARTLLRREGPVAVSVLTATPEVLRAVIQSVTDEIRATALTREILRGREEGTLDATALTQAYEKAEVKPEDRPKLSGLLTAQPVLWKVIAEADAPAGVYPPRPMIRYGGLAVVHAGHGRDRSSPLQRNSSIVSWENLSDR